MTALVVTQVQPHQLQVLVPVQAQLSLRVLPHQQATHVVSRAISPRLRVALARRKHCTFCHFKGHTASVCRETAAALLEVHVELAGDERSPETGGIEDASHSLQLNTISANRVRGVGQSPFFWTQEQDSL